MDITTAAGKESLVHRPVRPCRLIARRATAAALSVVFATAISTSARAQSFDGGPGSGLGNPTLPSVGSVGTTPSVGTVGSAAGRVASIPRINPGAALGVGVGIGVGIVVLSALMSSNGDPAQGSPSLEAAHQAQEAARKKAAEEAHHRQLCGELMDVSCSDANSSAQLMDVGSADTTPHLMDINQPVDPSAVKQGGPCPFVNGEPQCGQAFRMDQNQPCPLDVNGVPQCGAPVQPQPMPDGADISQEAAQQHEATQHAVGPIIQSDMVPQMAPR